MTEKQCSITDCARPVTALGFCNGHYQRVNKRGDVNRPMWQNEGWSFDNPYFALHFWSRVALTADDERCWEWQGSRHDRGYGHQRIQGRTFSTHRIAWQLTYGVVPTLNVLHSCDNPPCVNPKHLFEGTQKDNISDMHAKNRHAVHKGSANGFAKLNEEQVREIKILLSQGVAKKALGRQFDVSAGTIGFISDGSTWSHITI